MLKIISLILAMCINHQALAARQGNLQYIRNGEIKNVTYAEIDGFAIAEGDIILTELNPKTNAKLDTLPRAVIISKIKGTRWKNGIMPFKISDKFESACQYQILSAMHDWEKHTNLKFIEITHENAAKYKDYLSFTQSLGKTNSSYVGRQGGAQIIKISTNCKKMTIEHEIGHALGLWHEQSRADRDQYIEIIWDNIEAKHVFNFKQHLNDGEDIGDYDYNSIMHYSAYAFSKNGQKTIVPIHANATIGQRKKLSKKDIAAINYIYNAHTDVSQ